MVLFLKTGGGGMGLERDKVPFQLTVSVFRLTLSEYNQ